MLLSCLFYIFLVNKRLLLTLLDSSVKYSFHSFNSFPLFALIIEFHCDRCQFNVNDCANNPCLNGGRCYDGTYIDSLGSCWLPLLMMFEEFVNRYYVYFQRY